MIDAGGALSDIEAGLRARAEMLRSAGSSALQSLDQSGWTGHRATQLRNELLARQRTLIGLAEDCEQAAVHAHNLLGSLGDELRRVHRLEDDVRSWLRKAGPELLVQMPGRLPDHGSPDWLHVAAVMHRIGGL